MAVIHHSTVVASTETAPAWLKQAFLASGQVIWVDSVTGDDTDAGSNRKEPKASIFGASGALSVVTADAGQIIVCEKTHREAPSSAYTWSKGGVTLVSLGSGTDRAQITSGVAGVLLTLTGDRIEIENMYFAAASAATTDVIKQTTGNLAEVRDCYFQLGANNVDAVETSNATGFIYVKGSTFIVTAGAASQAGVHASGGSDAVIDDCTFDGGSIGFASAAFSIAAAGSDNSRIRNATLQNYAVGKVATGAKCKASFTADGTSRVEWTE